MRRIISRLHRERGQVLVMFVGIFTIIAVVGLVVVDFGMWFSERRGAQTDADMSALAGAQAYVADLTDTAGAFDDAVEWAVKNGVDPAEIDPSPVSECSDGSSCIQVGVGGCYENGTDTAMPWVESKIRHNTRTLFGSFFDFAAPDIGATARACVGSPRTMTDLTSFGLQTDLVPADGPPETGADCDNDKDDDRDHVINDGCGPISDCLEEDPDNLGHTRPVYGAVCVLRENGGDGPSGQRGFLSLGAVCTDKSASDLKHDLRYGTAAVCTVGEDVNSENGGKGGMVATLADRLAKEGLCDQLFSTGHAGYDDFDEVFSLPGAAPGDPIVPSNKNVFSENECRITEVCPVGHTHRYNPRVINLILVDRYVRGGHSAEIVGFAAFYIVGCFDNADAPAVQADIEQDLTKMDDYMNECQSGGGGQDVILGVFVEKLAPPMNPGDPDPNLPLSIFLAK